MHNLVHIADDSHDYDDIFALIAAGARKSGGSLAQSTFPTHWSRWSPADSVLHHKYCQKHNYKAPSAKGAISKASVTLVT